MWTFNGAVIPNIGLNAVAGRPKEEYGVEPTAFDEMRPGCYDVHERIKDMNAGGVLGSMCFPSFPGFSGRLFAAADDKNLALAVRAGLQRLAHRRLVRGLPRPLHPDGASRALGRRAGGGRGVRRVAAKGCHSLTFTENPATLGYPSFHDAPGTRSGRRSATRAWSSRSTSASSGKLAVTAPDAPVDVMITLQPMNICRRRPTCCGPG